MTRYDESQSEVQSDMVTRSALMYVRICQSILFTVAPVADPCYGMSIIRRYVALPGIDTCIIR